MSDYLLIHGAWHAAWCWDGIVAGLARAGHRAVAIDLPGMGADRAPLADASLDSWSQRVVGELERFDTPPILVGHSMGGMVITAAAQKAPQRIAGLVYVCAFLPQEGESLASLISRAEGGDSVLEQQVSPDGVASVVPPDAALRAFYGACDPAIARAAAARLTPQPLQPVLDPLPAGNLAAAALRKTYVECTRDGAIPVSLQRFMWARVPGIRVHTLTADHSPFLSTPDGLLQVLLTNS
jgi:pimeloyl-ACP methyl ester carboxylesterase